MAVESYQTCRTGRTGLTTKKLTTENWQRKTDNEKPTTKNRQRKPANKSCWFFVQLTNKSYICTIKPNPKSMTQLVLNIENPAILPSLKKVLSALEGVSIAKNTNKSLNKKKRTGLDEALEDVKAGRVSGPFNNVEELMAHLMKWAIQSSPQKNSTNLLRNALEEDWKWDKINRIDESR